MNIFDDELGQAGAQKSMSNYGENMRKKVFKVKKTGKYQAMQNIVFFKKDL